MSTWPPEQQELVRALQVLLREARRACDAAQVGEAVSPGLGRSLHDVAAAKAEYDLWRADRAAQSALG